MYICILLIKFLNEEKVGLQYIGGYVFYKFYIKYVSKLLESEQVIFIFKVGKLEDQNVIECQKLILFLNRGGLWVILKNVQLIFERIEYYFRDVISKFNV